jgi:hypothetical protein
VAFIRLGRSEGEEQMANEGTEVGRETYSEEATFPLYVPPRIVTYTADEIAEQIGPALMCSPHPETCPTID